MTMRVRTTLATVLATVAAVWAAGSLGAWQQPPAPPVFRSGADLVRVDIRVTGADGAPIRDLRADEVQIDEGGEPRPLLFFQHIEQPRGTYTDAARRTIASEISTNQGAPRGHLYVLVFDQTHIKPGNEQKARVAAQRFLRTRLAPGDRVALHCVPGPGPDIPFTAEFARVISQLSAVRGMREELGTAQPPMRVFDAYQITRGNPNVLSRYVDQFIIGAAADAQARPTAGNAARAVEDPAIQRMLIQDTAKTVVARADLDSRQFLQRLADIIVSLRGVEGRKSIILFSEGFESDNVTREMETVSAAAAQSSAVVYALDLNQRAVALDETDARGGEQYVEIASRLEPLGSLAAESDGVLFNDAAPQIESVFERIVGTSQDYYLVGFAPSTAALENRDRYSRIRVSVNRLGARVDARSGYAVGEAPNPASRRTSIEAALGAPFSQQGLQVEYTTYALKGAAGDSQRVILSLAAQLPVRGAQHTTADVLFAVRSVQTGRIAESGSGTMELPAVPRPGSTTGTGYYRAQMQLPPGIYMMRVVVREPGGLLGSADRRFQVRSLGGPGVQVGDLILGSSAVEGLPVRAAVYSTDVISGVFEVYARTAAQLENLRVLVELLPFGTTSALTSGSADLDPIRTGTGGASRAGRIAIPLKGIPPGEYVVRTTVRSGAETAAERIREVEILAGSPPATPPRALDAAGGPLTTFAPAAVLGGDVVRRYVDEIERRAKGQALEKALELARAGKWADVETAVPSGLTSTEARALTGMSRFARREFAAATTEWRACAEASAGDARPAFLLGWALAAGGDDRGAVGAWRAAFASDSAFVPAYLAAIEAYLRLGQPDLALQVARSGLTALPDSIELRNRVERLEKK
jgi:VWFA-related protein